MKTKIFNVVAGVGLIVLNACNAQENAKKEISMEKELDKVSYSLGVTIGNNVKSQGLDSLNVEAFSKAIQDVYAGKETQINAAEANQAIQAYFGKLEEKKSAVARKAGEEFLAANKNKEGVITLPSGLQYTIMKEGNGPKPTLTSKVTTHYHGTTIDGNVFDSSVERGQPASFPVNGVIAGWTEALQLMPVGSKWKLFIPSDLAYGARGAGPKIGPHSTLIFEVELLSID